MKKMKPLVILYVSHEMKVKQWNNAMFNEWEKYAEPRDNQMLEIFTIKYFTGINIVTED